MSFRNRISQTLHEEHDATLALMQRLDQHIARHRRSGPPDVTDAAVAKLLSDLSAGVETEFQRHFAFEEDELFGYLRANGEEALGAHLADEHTVIRPIGMRLATVARRAMAAGFDAATWEEFCRLGQELCGLMHGHVQKEEMALLPLIEDSMDAHTEARLFEEYLETT